VVTLLLLLLGAGAHGCHELWIIPQHGHSHWPVVSATRQHKQQLQGPRIHCNAEQQQQQELCKCEHMYVHAGCQEPAAECTVAVVLYVCMFILHYGSLK
jgi:hypothetical protein